MRSVTINTGVQTQAPKRHKAVRHIANGAVVAGGLTGINYGVKRLGRGIPSYSPNLASEPKIVQKAGKFFMKLGEKMFPKNSPITEVFERYAKDLFEDVGGAVKKYKGKWALLSVCLASALALVGAGIYKAGKINGEGN